MSIKILKGAIKSVSGFCVLAAFSLGSVIIAQAEEVSFEGETVSIMVNYAAGGGTDTAARLVAPFVAKHLPGNPKLIVTNKAGAGGVAALNYLIDSVAPDGMTIGYFSGTLQRWAQGLGEVPEETAGLPFVVGRSVNQIIVKRVDFPVTLETVSTTTEPIFSATNSPTSHVAIRKQLFMKMMGRDNFTEITGYKGNNKMVAAARSNETHLAETNDSYFGANREALFADNVLEIFGQLGEYVDGKIVAQRGIEDIPVFDNVLKKQKPEAVDTVEYKAWEAFHIAMSANNVFVLPPNTPAEFQAAWEKAILAAYNDPGYVQKLMELGLPEASVMGSTGVQAVKNEIKKRFDNEEIKAVVDEMIQKSKK